jgi:hypothetical protein
MRVPEAVQPLYFRLFFSELTLEPKTFPYLSEFRDFGRTDEKGFWTKNIFFEVIFDFAENCAGSKLCFYLRHKDLPTKNITVSGYL